MLVSQDLAAKVLEVVDVGLVAGKGRPIPGLAAAGNGEQRCIKFYVVSGCMFGAWMKRVATITPRASFIGVARFVVRSG